MKVSPELSEKIQKAINEFISDSSPFPVAGEKTNKELDLRKIAFEINVLPIAFDWFTNWGIQPSGEIIFFSYEKPYEVDLVTNQKIINMVLFRMAKKYPDLKELKPIRSTESITCPGCEGTGILKEFAHDELLSKGVNCNCGGVGWLPSADEKYLYF
jgi:hypothetical protein